MQQLVMDVLEEAARVHQSRPAMRVKRNGAWHTTTWGAYRDQAHTVAKAFIKLGLGAQGGVAIIGFNRPEWIISNTAAIYAGGIPAGIYTTNSPEQCHYVADHCEAAIAVVEDAEQLAKFKAVRDRLPSLKAIILMEGTDSDEQVHSWDEILQLGAAESDDELQARIAAQKPDDVCTLIYTSGTTGNPKGVMLTHDNLTWTARAAMNVLMATADDELISYLPLSHIAEQEVVIHGPMVAGCCVNFAESIEALGDNLKEIRPTLMLGVPRVWEKIQAKIQDKGAAAPPLRKKIAAWARKIGLQAGYAMQNKTPQPLLYGLANRIVFSKVRKQLGLDRCRLQATAAAPISKDTLEFFMSLGVVLYEIYGMSECTGPATVSTPTRFRLAKAGWCLPGAELKIADDGEICMRGRHVFKGYYKNPEATAETIDAEGWLHSGDIGTIDADGYLQITDRKKDLIITAGGENIAPQLIEGQLKSIPVISQAVVIGDRRKFLSALITLDPEKVKTIAQNSNSSANDVGSAAECSSFQKYLDSEIANINNRLARVQTIKKYTILTHDFTIEGGELTPTMKLKRRVINDKYSQEIEGMYAN